jgi:hypothetical protein
MSDFSHNTTSTATSTPPTPRFTPLPTFRCNFHGDLPTSSFYASDLKVNRHRCRTCRGSLSVKCRSNRPLQSLWSDFLKKVKRKFVVDSDFNSVYNYADRGRPLLLWIFAAKYNMHNENQISEWVGRIKPVLTWPTGTKKLFFKDLILMSREAARHRGRRKGSRNIKTKEKRQQIVRNKQLRLQ